MDEREKPAETRGGEIIDKLRAEILDVIAVAADKLIISVREMRPDEPDEKEEFQAAVQCLNHWTKVGERMELVGETRGGTDDKILSAALAFMEFIRRGGYCEVVIEELTEYARTVFRMLTSVYELHCFTDRAVSEEKQSE